MKGRNFVWIALLGLGVFAGGVAAGQDPGLWQRHPALADVERNCHVALDKINQAWATNPPDPGGHLARARDLIMRADREITAAAVAADGGPH
jgi:hypothetical protein